MERPLNDQADLRIGDIAALMRHARKSASYKPALLKALVRCCRQSDDLHIPLDAIGREFTKLYWNQTVVYHLRQAASLSKESTAVKLIRRTAQAYKARDLAELPAAGRAKIDRQMSKLLTVNVLTAFHASRLPEMPLLYRWEPGQDHVVVTPKAHSFRKLRRWLSSSSPTSIGPSSWKAVTVSRRASCRRFRETVPPGSRCRNT